MPIYNHFARYYDALMNDPLENAERVLGYRERHLPQAAIVFARVSSGSSGSMECASDRASSALARACSASKRSVSPPTD